MRGHAAKHCSSLCSQSEGYEHVANMALLDFQPVLGRHNLRPPHFASKVSYSAAPHEIRCYVVPIKNRADLPSEVGPALLWCVV